MNKYCYDQNVSESDSEDHHDRRRGIKCCNNLHGGSCNFPEGMHNIGTVIWNLYQSIEGVWEKSTATFIDYLLLLTR